ncbi:MAG: hypothetical protein RL584_1127 [Pseudomonadota bacterium]
MTLRRFVERLFWLSILPLLVLGVILIVVQVQMHDARRQMVAEAVVRTAARAVEQDLEVQLASLTMLARLLEEEARHDHGRWDLVKARRMMLQYVAQKGHHVLLESAGGPVLVNTRLPDREAAPADLPPHPIAARALSRQVPVVGDAFWGPIAQTHLVALAVPVNQGLGTEAALMGTIELAYLNKRLQSFSLPERWQLHLADGQGQRLAQAGIDQQADHKRAALGGDTPVQQVRLVHAPWTLTLHAPALSTLDSATAQAIALLVALGACVVVVYRGSHLTATRLSDAMRRLTQVQQTTPATDDIEEVNRVRKALDRLALQRDLAQEAERKRIGLELHDDLQQKLALLKHQLEVLARGQPVAPTPSAGPAPQTADHAKAALTLVDQTIESTRRMVQDLRPAALDDGDLPAALVGLAEQYRQLTGQTVDVQTINEPACEQIPSLQAAMLYRMAQELLNNVRKHALARCVSITLDGSSTKEVVLEVSDDGIGLSPQARGASPVNGLWGIQERVHLLGGTLSIFSEPGQGSAFVVRVPVGSDPNAYTDRHD